MHRWAEADQLRSSPQIIRLRAHVRARYSVITQSADNSDVLNEPEEEQLGYQQCYGSNKNALHETGQNLCCATRACSGDSGSV